MNQQQLFQTNPSLLLQKVQQLRCDPPCLRRLAELHLTEPRLNLPQLAATVRTTVIKKTTIAKDSEDDAVEEGAVGGGEPVATGMSIDQRLGIDVALRPGPQGGDCGAADILFRHRLGDWGTLIGDQGRAEKWSASSRHS